MSQDFIYRTAVCVLCALLSILFAGQVFFLKTFFDDVRTELKVQSETVWQIRQQVAVLQATQNTAQERSKR